MYGPLMALHIVTPPPPQGVYYPKMLCMMREVVLTKNIWTKLNLVGIQGTCSCSKELVSSPSDENFINSCVGVGDHKLNSQHPPRPQ